MSSSKQWWDNPTSKGVTPMQIIKLISKDLNLTPGDINLILTRAATINEKKLLVGHGHEKIILASVYNFIQSEKTPINAKAFSHVCRKNGLVISDTVLMRLVGKVRSAKIFEETISPEKVIKKKSSQLSKRFHIDNEGISNILESIKIAKKHGVTAGKSPYMIAGATVWFTCHKNNYYVTQDDVAALFVITSVGMRKYIKQFEEII